jgi:hypothetical protein
MKKVNKTEYKRAETICENYKGIYCGDDDEQKYYEGGAHFKYRELCFRLEQIVEGLSPERRGKFVYNDHGYYRKDINNMICEDNMFEKTNANSRKYCSDNSKVYS